jgi:predicted TIM-barrel fold metal-dependent hydrolase
LEILIAMPLDLTSVPILDHHCHAFLKRAASYTALEFQGFFSEGGDNGIVAEHTPNSVFFRWAVKELAKFLGCDPTTEAVLQARAAMPLRELAARMLRDVNIPCLLIDYGLGGPERMSVEEMRANLPNCHFEPILRLETMAQDLILKHETFDQVVEAFVGTVEAARATGHVGLKSIIAYRTGLAIRETSRADAAEVFLKVKERARRAQAVRLADKPLNDYLLLRALEVAEKQALPVQFHTGLGDNDLDMLYANPLHMRPLFESSQYKHVPFVLLHASYPYVRELGYLASLYSHVWMDLGLAVPFATLDIPSVWRQALSLTPTSKILFSTDAYSIPDIYWIAARWGRSGLARVLDELIALEAFTQDEALEAAHQILHGNAEKLYAIDL